MSNDSPTFPPAGPNPPAASNEHPVLRTGEHPADQEPRPDSASDRRDLHPPSLARQAWNLAESLADFVADGCHPVTAEQYRQRLEICDACDSRRDNGCMKCGCRLSLKARGRAFRCPAKKWPDTKNRK